MTFWLDTLPEEERTLIARAGYGRRRGIGPRPALLLIDCQHNFVGADEPLLDQIDRYPSGAGERAWRAVERIAEVLQVSRDVGIPVIHTRYCYPEQGLALDSFAKKRGTDNTRFLTSAPGTQIVEPLAPRPGELVLDKAHASAFFATPLIAYLVGLGIDSLLVAGFSTSGCVRTTAVDAASQNFDVTVMHDAVGDRIRSSHTSALLDLWMKYADVVGTAEVVEHLRAAGRAP